MKRRRALIAVGIAITLLAPGCGISERKHRADVIVEAPDRAAQAGTATAIFASAGLRVLEARRAVDVTVVVVPPYEGTADFERRRASLEPTTDVPEEIRNFYRSAAGVGTQTSVRTPRLAFAGDTIYAVRVARGPSGRAWVALDLSKVRRVGDELVAVGFPTIGPIVLLDLLRGALAGSVERVGTEKVGGTSTTHYRVNLDREKAFRDLPDDERRTLDRAFGAMGAPGPVYPSEVWLDDEGRPRRMIVRITQRVDRVTAFELAIGLELFDYGTRRSVTVPGSDETARVQGLGELLRNLGI